MSAKPSYPKPMFCVFPGFRRAGANGSPEIIAVHPGVIATNIVATDGIAKRIMSAAFITPQAGAQSSIFAASCPSSDIPEDKL